MKGKDLICDFEEKGFLTESDLFDCNEEIETDEIFDLLVKI